MPVENYINDPPNGIFPAFNPLLSSYCKAVN